MLRQDRTTPVVEKAELSSLIRDLYHAYWPVGTAENVIEAEVKRLALPLRIITEMVPSGALVCDVGGGWGAFSCALAKIGFRSVMLDDFRDRGFFEADKRHDLPVDYGVEFIQRDAAQEGVGFPPESVDAFVSLHSIEHWHRGPKKALDTMMDALKPGGLLLLAGPNANDFAKRITVPLGVAEWAPFEEWYTQPVYRSHVHELTVRDLHRIAEDLRLVDVSIFGTCLSGLQSPSRLVRAIIRPLGYLFRLRPSLCTEIYLQGRKPGG